MRLNGRMSKKQPALLLGLVIGGLIIFQNCSKVGVEDLALVDQKVGAQGEAIPVDDGSMDPMNTPADQAYNPGSNPVSNPGNGQTSSPMPASSEPPQMPPLYADNNGDMPPSHQPPSMPPQGDGDDDSMPSPNQPPKLPPVVDMPPTEEPPVMPPVVDMPSQDPPVLPPVMDDEKPAVKCEKIKSLGIQISNSKMISVKCLLNPDHKCVVVCHKPAKANKKARVKLVRSEKALKAHLSHGDTLGLCADINSRDEDACESVEVERKPKKYKKEHKGRHFDDKGKKCNRDDDHEHKDGPGDDRDDDDDHDEDHDRRNNDDHGHSHSH